MAQQVKPHTCFTACNITQAGGTQKRGIMFELYGINPLNAVNDIDDNGDPVTYNPSILLTRTNDPARLETIRRLAESDGFTDLRVFEYDPEVFEKPDFAQTIQF